MKYLTKINPLKTALFISIFEFFTLLILPYLRFKAAITGFFDGFIGGLLAILLFNLISSEFKLPLCINNKKNVLNKLGVLIASLGNGLFISLLFVVQQEIVFAFRSEILNDALVGFSATFVAMIGCIATYNILIKFTKIRLSGVLSDKKFKIGRIDLLRSCFFVALFEFFILPAMGIFFILFENLPFYLTFPLVGFFGGFIGSLLASFCYNFFAKYLKGISFKIE